MIIIILNIMRERGKIKNLQSFFFSVLDVPHERVRVHVHDVSLIRSRMLFQRESSRATYVQYLPHTCRNFEKEVIVVVLPFSSLFFFALSLATTKTMPLLFVVLSYSQSLFKTTTAFSSSELIRYSIQNDQSRRSLRIAILRHSPGC